MGTIIRPDLRLSSSSSKSLPYETVKTFTEVSKHASVVSPHFKVFSENFAGLVYQLRRQGICSSVNEVELHFSQGSALSTLVFCLVDSSQILFNVNWVGIY